MKTILLVAFLAFSLDAAQAHVNLTYPTGGEMFSPGEVVTIQWQQVIMHNTLNWDLYVSYDGGSTWEDLRLDIGVDTLFYNWTVPDHPDNMVRIRVVQDNIGSNYSDQSNNFTINGASGVGEVPVLPDLKVYPNPARGYFYVDYGQTVNGAEVQLANSAGAIVETYPSSNGPVREVQEFQISGVSRGMYYIIIKTEKGTVSHKLVIR